MLAASILFVAHWSHSAIYVSEPVFRHAGSLADSQGTESDMEFLNDCTHWQAVSSKWGSLLSSSPLGSREARRSWLETSSCLTSMQSEEERRSSDVLHAEEKPLFFQRDLVALEKRLVYSLSSAPSHQLISLLPMSICSLPHLLWRRKSWVATADTCPLWCDPIHTCAVFLQAHSPSVGQIVSCCWHKIHCLHTKLEMNNRIILACKLV